MPDSTLNSPTPTLRIRDRLKAYFDSRRDRSSFDDSDPLVRKQAIEAAEYLSQSQRTQAMEDGDPMVRLAAYRRGESWDRGRDKALNDPDASIRCAAMDSRWPLREGLSEEQVVSALEDLDPDVRRSIISYGHAITIDPLHLLRATILDDNDAVREAGIAAINRELYANGGAEKLHDADPRVRQSALLEIGEHLQEKRAKRIAKNGEEGLLSLAAALAAAHTARRGVPALECTPAWALPGVSNGTSIPAPLISPVATVETLPKRTI